MLDEHVIRQQPFQSEETTTVSVMEMHVRERLMNNLVSTESVPLSELFDRMTDDITHSDADPAVKRTKLKLLDTTFKKIRHEIFG